MLWRTAMRSLHNKNKNLGIHYYTCLSDIIIIEQCFIHIFKESRLLRIRVCAAFQPILINCIWQNYHFRDMGESLYCSCIYNSYHLNGYWLLSPIYDLHLSPRWVIWMYCGSCLHILEFTIANMSNVIFWNCLNLELMIRRIMISKAKQSCIRAHIESALIQCPN